MIVGARVPGGQSIVGRIRGRRALEDSNEARRDTEWKRGEISSGRDAWWMSVEQESKSIQHLIDAVP
jgi:hypothetical protein